MLFRSIKPPWPGTVEASDQSVLKFESLVHLVTAAYAKNEDGVTSGLSIALVAD